MVVVGRPRLGRLFFSVLRVVNLKNYTSSVAAATTISYIEAYLAECGVSAVSKQYEDGIPVALFFHIDVPSPVAGGLQKFTVRLPAKVKDVQEYLWRTYCSSTRRPRKTREDFKEQAAKTAWKIQQDWVQVQMSLIKLKQADFVEVFMGFLWTGHETYYEKLKSSGLKALPMATEPQSSVSR